MNKIIIDQLDMNETPSISYCGQNILRSKSQIYQWRQVASTRKAIDEESTFAEDLHPLRLALQFPHGENIGGRLYQWDTEQE